MSMFVVNFQDHINFTIGRQCFNLKQLNNAMVAFKHLLGTSNKQPSIQQAAFLREYLFVYRVSMLLTNLVNQFFFVTLICRWVCACMHACVRACVRACMYMGTQACVFVCMPITR